MTVLREIEGQSTAASGPAGHRIQVIQHGPCWCRAGSGTVGSFDFIRSRGADLTADAFDRNLLLVSDRVIAGTERSLVQAHRRLPDPKLVVAVGHCPATDAFWDELPGGWVKAEEVIPVELHVAECASGRPEALLAAVLEWQSAEVATTERDAGAAIGAVTR